MKFMILAKMDKITISASNNPPESVNPSIPTHGFDESGRCADNDDFMLGNTFPCEHC